MNVKDLTKTEWLYYEWKPPAELIYTDNEAMQLANLKSKQEEIKDEPIVPENEPAQIIDHAGPEISSGKWN